MGYDLNGPAEKVAAPFAGDDRCVDLTRRDVVPGEIFVDEPLVVSKIKIGLGAVIGDEDLAVLIRRHRARIDVDVRIELLHTDMQAARLQDRAEGRCGNSLPSEETTPPVTNTNFAMR